MNNRLQYFAWISAVMGTAAVFALLYFIIKGIAIYLPETVPLNLAAVNIDQKPQPSQVDNTNSISWSFEGRNGPEYWYELKQENKICGNGRYQSPIHISGWIEPEIPARFDTKILSSIVQLDVDHLALGAKYEAGSSIDFSGKRYYLTEFRFKTPAEHKINKKEIDGEIVFYFQDKRLGERLNLIIPMQSHPKPNTVLVKILENLPEVKDVPGKKFAFDAQKLIPSDSRFYSYIGSLTYPPCDEGVQTLVLDKPLQLSPEQLHKIQRINGENARPLQSSYARTIELN